MQLDSLFLIEKEGNELNNLQLQSKQRKQIPLEIEDSF